MPEATLPMQEDALWMQRYAYEEAFRLIRLSRTHELLCYALAPDAMYEGFIARFGQPGRSRDDHRHSYAAIASAYALYFLVLREACEEIEREQRLGPLPPAPTSEPADAITEDDVPY